MQRDQLMLAMHTVAEKSKRPAVGKEREQSRHDGIGQLLQVVERRLHESLRPPGVQHWHQLDV
jgi:hypothetical protein